MKPRGRLKRLRRLGLIPRIGLAVWWLARALVRYPQPIMLGIVIGLAGWGFAAYAEHGSAFRVTAVVVPPEPAFTLPRALLGENIWRIDVRALSEDLHAQHPSLRVVRVTRRLPDTIAVESVQRVPVAQVRLDHWHPADAEGFVLPAAGGEAAEGLLRVTGLNRPRIRAGQVNEDESLQLALRVREALRRYRPALARRVTEINAGDPEQIMFVLDDATEVRCGTEAELPTHLDRLQGALRALAKEAITVRYIDLRFPEPVIGPAT